VSPELVGGIGIGVLLLLFALRMPVGLSMLLVGFLGYWYLTNAQAGLSKLGMDLFAAASSYSLSVIPLFILMGMFLSYGGWGHKLYESINAWFGNIRGGMAMATVGTCAAFASICGSATATVATMAKVALPEMRKYGYKDSLATACVAAGGTLGILIPPSVILVMYGVLTEEPIGELLIAGVLPGIIQAILFMGTIYLMVRRDPSLAPRSANVTPGNRLVSSRGAWPVIAIFGLAMGGIYFGVFTPTEAGAIGAFAALVFTLASRRLSYSSLVSSLDETARMTAMIFIILIGAMIFSHFLAITEIPFRITDLVAGLGMSRYVVLAIVLLLLVFAGAFIEGIAVMVLTLPILYPLVTSLGFDGLWFGVVMVIMLNIGLLTPPIGINVYVVSGIVKDVPPHTIFRAVVPFWLSIIAFLALLLAFPGIATFLPSLMR